MIVYGYFKFNLHYIKNLKLLAIRIPKLFESIVLRKIGDGFFLSLGSSL